MLVIEFADDKKILILINVFFFFQIQGLIFSAITKRSVGMKCQTMFSRKNKEILSAVCHMLK